MKVKKKLKFAPFLAVVFAVLLFVFTLGFASPAKKSTSSASAFGFEDAGANLNNYRVNIEFSYSDRDPAGLYFTHEMLKNSAYGAYHGFGLFNLIGANSSYINGSTFVNVAIFFDGPFLDFGLYDFYVSDGAYIDNVYMFDRNGAIIQYNWDWFIEPMFTTKYYKIQASNNDLCASISFRIPSTYFLLAIDAYLQNYLDWYFFIYEKDAFVDFGDAYDSGYNAGLDAGYNNGYEAGLSAGDNQGFNRGYQLGLSQSNTFTGLLSAVFDVPVRTFFGMLNFDLLGINMANFVMSIFTLCLVIVLLRKVL